VGDVITFNPPGRVPRTTHRVVARHLHDGKWYFETKGDSNPTRDDWRAPSNDPNAAPDTQPAYARGISYGSGTAVRMAAHVPYLGYLAEISARPRLRVVLVALPFAFAALQLLAWVWGVGGRPKDAEQPTSERRRRPEPEPQETQAA
jgi:hypothetical protein